MRDSMYDLIYRTEKDHWWYRVRRQLVLDLLTGIAKERGGRLRILDVGCGTGLLMREMQRFGPVEGVDVSERAVEYCHTRGLSPKVASAAQLPHADSSFDVVVILDVLEHLEDDAQGAHEVARVLVPGGVALVAVPAFQFLWGVTDETSHHFRRYTKSRLARVLEGAGLRVRRATYFNFFLFPGIAFVRLCTRALGIKLKSENTLGGAFANGILYRIFALEPPLLRFASFPFGVSALAIARKPDAAEAPSAGRARRFVPLAKLFGASAVAGGIAALLQIALYALFAHVLGIWYLAATTIAYVLGVGVNFVLQKWFVFVERSRHRVARQLVQFSSLGFVNVGLNALFMYLLVGLLGASGVLSQAIVLIVLRILNFGIYHRIIFATRHESD